MSDIFQDYLIAFSTTDLAKAMQETKENSPYHREDSVWVHTMMMLNVLEKTYAKNLSQKECVMVALAILFHDVGKPNAKKELFNEAYGGKYFSFKRHESISARIFESLAMRDYVSYEKAQNIKKLFRLDNNDIYTICWMIENHLIYRCANQVRDTLLIDASLMRMYFTLVRCDVRGRIADEHALQIQQVEDTILDIQTSTRNTIDRAGQPICYFLIGAPGVGKSTYCKNKLNGITQYSWDSLRIQFYVENAKVSTKVMANEKDLYDKAHEYSTTHRSEFARYTDSIFVQLLNTQQALIVDNTNTIKRNRTELIDMAKKKGYQVIAIYFLSDIETLYQRNKSRPDKYLTEKTINKLYYNTTMPTLSEFDLIMVQ